MFRKEKQFIKRVSALRLTQKEKAYIRNEIFSYMQENPVRAENASVRGFGNPKRNFLWKFFGTVYRPAFAGAIMICILVFGVSFSYAAENALPGDALYPVKIYINENIRTALAVTAQAQAGWGIRQAERRLEEAEKLASEGRLSAQASAEISTSFQAHTAQIHKNIEQFKSKGQINDAAEISSNLEASLFAHKKILSELNKEENKKDKKNNENEDEKKETKDILQDIGMQAEETHEIRKKAEEKINAQIKNNSKISAQNRRRAAHNKIQEVRNFLSKWKNKLGAKVVLDAEIKLQEGERAIAEGDAKVQAGRSGEAFALYQKAHRIAQEAKLLLEARRSLNIDIRVNEEEDRGEEVVDDHDAKQEDTILQENDKQNSQKEKDKKNENDKENNTEDVKKIEGNVNASLKTQKEMREKLQEEARKRLEDMKKNVNKVGVGLEVEQKSE